MLLRGIVLMITGLLSLVPASYAATIDSLLAKYIAIPKPYIIVYTPANNCDFHRGAEGRRTLLEIKWAIPPEKVMLLFDDDFMRTHVKNNTEVYEGFRTCYNKEIADALPTGKRSVGGRLYFVTDTGIACYRMPVKVSDFIDIANVIVPYDKEIIYNDANNYGLKELDYNLTEGMFADKYMNFEFNKKTTLLHADRFQTGLIKSGKKTSLTESALDDSSMAFIYQYLSQYVADSFRTVNHSKGFLKTLMTPLVDIKNIRIAGNDAYVLFNVNTVSEKTNIHPYKMGVDFSNTSDTVSFSVIANVDSLIKSVGTTYEETVSGKTFVAKVDLNKKDNPFNLSLSNCEGYSWLNHREFDGESHIPVEGINIETAHDTILVPLHAYKTGSKGAAKDSISVGTYTFNSMNKMVLTKIYKTSFNDNRINQFLLRAKNGHEPFIIDRVHKSITTLADNREIALDKYTSVIFDAQMRDNGIVFTGLNDKYQTTVSFFDFKSRTVTSSRIIDTAAATNATIAANTVQWYRKGSDQKLKLNSYSIKDFGNPTPFTNSLRVNRN